MDELGDAQADPDMNAVGKKGKIAKKAVRKVSKKKKQEDKSPKPVRKS